MSETPLAERKVENNSSGLLTNYHAYSPNPPPLPKEEHPSKPDNTSQADSIEKILSSSIQRAKQKITMLEGRPREDRGENRQERVGSKEGHPNNANNAVAAAIKVLQSRVSELQCNIENHERERAILLKQLDNLTDQKKIILANLQQSNLKITTLQQNNRNYKAEIKEYNKRLQANQNTLLQLQTKCKTLEMNVKHLEQDKQQLNAQFVRREQEIANRSSSSQKQLASKVHETEQKERQLQEKEKKLNEREKRLIQFENSLRERKENKELQQRRELNELAAQNAELRKELAELQRRVSDQQQQIDEKTRYEIDIDKIRELEMEINMLRQTTKHLEEKEHHNGERNEEEIDYVHHENRNLRNQNEELIYQYKRAEEKIKREEKETKLMRDRARELEDLLSEVVQKIGKLPNCPKDLKYLTVKAGKLINSHIERINTLKTPTKSRSNSLNRSLSRSNSQRKNTQESKITNSRHSKSKGESGSKSKRKEQSATKTKRVVVSQAGPAQNTDREVAELKKEYKRLVKILDETENEQIRNKLNEIAFAIQEKNERATKLRQANRIK